MYQTHSGTGTFGKLSRHMGGKSLAAALVAACLLMVGSRGAAAPTSRGDALGVVCDLPTGLA